MTDILTLVALVTEGSVYDTRLKVLDYMFIVSATLCCDKLAIIAMCHAIDSSGTCTCMQMYMYMHAHVQQCFDGEDGCLASSIVVISYWFMLE